MEARFNNCLLSWNTKKYFDKGDPYQCYCQKHQINERKISKIEIQTLFNHDLDPRMVNTLY